jgi:hypothetical protein
MRQRLLSQVVAVCLCVLMLPWQVFGQSQSAGKISAVLPATTQNAKLARKMDAVRWNDMLKTDPGGRARVALDDGSLLSLGSSSELKIVQHNGMAQQTQIEMGYGRLRSRVVKLTATGARFEIKTPTAVIGVIGTDFYVEATPTRTIVICYTGLVSVAAVGAVAAAQASVPAGSMVEASANGVSAVQPTPINVQQQSIQDTEVNEMAAGGHEKSHTLRNVLIGIAAAGVVTGIAWANWGGPSVKTPTQPPPIEDKLK